jgi:uncharacterized protein (DUF1330 family)
MAVYFIAHFVVKDPALFVEYQKVAGATLAPFNVKPISIDAASETLEGTPPGPVTVVIEFESREKLKEWYTSPAYEAVRSKRLDATEGFTVISEGMNTGSKA